jgi:hypothetical protein
LPVLVPDGERGGSGHGLFTALIGDGAGSWLVRPRSVSLADLRNALTATPRPRVLILCDLPPLTDEQSEAVDRFVRAGGGVLVTVGPRTRKDAVQRLYAGADGWLPSVLVEEVKEENEGPTSPRPSSFRHAALEPFRSAGDHGLGRLRLPHRWRLAAPEAGVAHVVAELTDGSPFLIERPHGKGRVLLCAAPLADVWGGNALSRPEFPILAYELVASLAGWHEVNLQPGQPLVYEPLDDEDGEQAELRTPTGRQVTLTRRDGVFSSSDTRYSGVYVLTTPRHRPVYFVVQPEPRTPDPTPATATEQQAVADTIGNLRYETEVGPILAGPDRDIWWLFLLGVIVLLCAEVRLTRRIVRDR